MSSNYRDTVRDMMNDMKPKSTTTDSKNEKLRENDEKNVEKLRENVPNEEDLLDDILDLEEGAPIDDEEADELLASSDHENGKKDL